MLEFFERFSDFQANIFFRELFVFLEGSYDMLEDLWNFIITRHLPELCLVGKKEQAKLRETDKES